MNFERYRVVLPANINNMEFVKKHFTMLFAVSTSFVFGLFMGMVVGKNIDVTDPIAVLDVSSYSEDR
jgi:hypothetical protein